jgi:oligopeptide/dipeptide ABC transporter ATP-binding protein
MRQRVLLAMGLLLDPQLIILDEPTTALDILTQRTIIDLLRRLKEELGFAVILVSHDLSLAAELADRVATVYAGRIVEFAPVRDLFYRPHHPYTLGLLSAVPTISGGFRPLESVKGSPPDLIDLPPGCTFHPRCPFARPECTTAEPELLAVNGTAAGMAPPEGHGHAGATPNGAASVGPSVGASATPSGSPSGSPAGPGGHLAACFFSDQVAAAWRARTARAAAPAESAPAPEPAGGA